MISKNHFICFSLAFIFFSASAVASELKEPSNTISVSSETASKVKNTNPLSPGNKKTEAEDEAKSDNKKTKPPISAEEFQKINAELSGIPTAESIRKGEKYLEMLGGINDPTYKSYSRETLIELGKQGDAAALNELFKRATAETSHVVVEEMLVHGYTYVPNIGASALIEATLNNSDRDPTVAQKNIIEQLAILYFIKLRGDRLSLFDAVSKNMDANQVERAMEKGEALFAEVARKRQQRGLPPLDTDIGKDLDELYIAFMQEGFIPKKIK